MKLSLVALSIVVLLQAQAPTPQAPLPTFRTGVDVVQLDVTVLDKDRHPVRGLTAEDFTILERGTLSTRILRAAGGTPSRQRLHEVYGELARCLEEGRLFA